MEDRRQVIETIERQSRFLVTAHRNPEADALGSSLALAHFLRELGKEATVVTVDPVPRVLSFLPHGGIHEQVAQLPSEGEVLFVLDCGDAQRTGLLEPGARPIKVVNIDHHVTNRRFGTVNWVDADAAATAELIYDLIGAMKRPISLPVALCLYTALSSETGSFGYSNTSSHVFRIASELVDLGVEPWQVAQRLRENTRERLRLLTEVLSSLDQTADGRIAWVTVTGEMFERTGATAEDTEDFVNLPRSLSGVEVAILFREVDSATSKVSFRSRNDVDVAKIAERFGGGGHKKAAGCTINGNLDQVRPAVLEAVAIAVG